MAEKQQDQYLREMDANHPIVFDNRTWMRITKLGRGEHGVVYLVEDGNGERQACKEIYCHSLDETDLDLESYTRESKMLQQNNHPNIIGFRGLDLDCIKRYRVARLFMQHCELGDLAKHVNTSERKITPGTIWKYFFQLAAALACCHYGVTITEEDNIRRFEPADHWEGPIYHRDVKPSNILVANQYDKIQLCDFGVGKRAGLDDPTYGTYTGTTFFRAPEISSEYGAAWSTKADIYSVGMTIERLIVQGLKLNADSNRVGDNLLAIISKQHPEFLPIYSIVKMCCDTRKKRPSSLTLLELLGPYSFEPTSTENPCNVVGWKDCLFNTITRVGSFKTSDDEHEANVVRRLKLLVEDGGDRVINAIEGSESLFFRAAHEGHDRVVRTLLEIGADIEAKTKDRWTALHIATNQEHKEVVKTLLEKGADTEAKTKDKWTALHLAAGRGYIELVKILLEMGADTEAKMEGRTTLHIATNQGHIEVVKALLEKGADTEAKVEGRTILHTAASQGHKEVVRTLLEIGADIEAKTKDRWTALHIAASQGHKEVVRTLLEIGADIEAKTKDRWTALHIATNQGHIEVVKTLLEIGVEIEAKIKDGWTALQIAGGRGYIEVLKTLLEMGADTEAKMEGRTTLHIATNQGHIEVVRVLLEIGVDIEAKTKDGWTALHIAAAKGHMEAVKMLLEIGADIEAEKRDGLTALHVAASTGHKNIVRMLLEKGADTEARTKKGETAQALVVNRMHREVLTVLQAKNLDTVMIDTQGTLDVY